MKRASLLEIHAIADKVNALLHQHPVLGPELAGQGRRGCFISVATLEGEEMLGTLLGEYPGEKYLVYQRFAREKIARLLKNHKELGHVLSRQSENKALEMFPGAALGDCAASISGYPSHGDELGSLAVLYQSGNLSFARVQAILTHHPNMYFDLAIPQVKALFVPF